MDLTELHCWDNFYLKNVYFCFKPVSAVNISCSIGFYPDYGLDLHRKVEVWDCFHLERLWLCFQPESNRGTPDWWSEQRLKTSLLMWTCISYKCVVSRTKHLIEELYIIAAHVAHLWVGDCLIVWFFTWLQPGPEILSGKVLPHVHPHTNLKKKKPTLYLCALPSSFMFFNKNKALLSLHVKL